MVYAKRFFIIAMVMVGLSSYFWLGSRYPDLNNKAMMAKSGSIADTLSVWPKFKIDPEDSFWQKTFYTTLNWCNDNKKGMTFGVLFGALAMTLLSYLRFTSLISGFRSLLYGFLMGTPLGVCVNCAAPVFKGMLRSRNLKMSLALMLSSPTMNVVVLTMTFSLFPFYLASIKVLFTLTMIFLFVPLLAKFLGDQEGILEFQGLVSKPQKIEPVYEGSGRALLQAGKDFLSNFRYLSIRTVPLMLVAGFLGAFLSHLIPANTRFDDISHLHIMIAAFVGTFLPTPVAFDVILTNALYQQGLAVSLTAILLCTLPIFSIYSFFIVWTSASKKWALSLFFLIMGAGASLGYVTDPLHKRLYVDPNIDWFRTHNHSSLHFSDQAIDTTSEEAAPARPRMAKVAFHFTQKGSGYRLYEADLPAPKKEPFRFFASEGHERGLTLGYRYGIRDYPDPFWIGRGSAGGDFDGNGLDDVAFGSNHGPLLYRNLGGHFERVHLPQPGLTNLLTYAVAFVDLDNDGYEDLFFSTWGEGNFYLKNEGGFYPGPLHKVPNSGGILTVAPGFHDFDGNGYLDILNGNMALGIVTGFYAYGDGRKNGITLNHNLSFEQKELPSLDGETMSTLISDLNQDGHADLYIANDFIVPDEILWGQADGSFQKASPSPLKTTPFYSMSADSADWDHDGDLDLLSNGSIAMRPEHEGKPLDGLAYEVYSQDRTKKDTCYGIKDRFVRKNCLLLREKTPSEALSDGRRLTMSQCSQGSDKKWQQECLLATMWLLITKETEFTDCDQDLGFDPVLKETCHLLKKRGLALTKKNFTAEAHQGHGFYLYQNQGQGQFQDLLAQKPQSYYHPGGWTWSTKFFDADLDGHMDIFNTEGTIREQGYGFSTFLHNNGHGQFDFATFSKGLHSDFNLFSFTLLDMDHDGDQDIIANSAEGPVSVFENRASNQRMVLTLKDKNATVIGSLVRVTLEDGTVHTHELKKSGGYQSFDPARIYIGLAELKKASSIEVRWPDGKEVAIKGPLLAQKHYLIERAD